jgi:murein DD-endopeptidase MepM/ murein hydrolase activator NlpD
MSRGSRFTEPLRRFRRQKLLEQTNARDDAARRQARSAQRVLADREQELHELRLEARAARDRLAAEQADLESQLRASQQALDAFEERLRREEAARQERERALLCGPARVDGTQLLRRVRRHLQLICPIRGPVSFVDSWGAARRATTGVHQGVDLMNPRGTPNVAVVSGRVEMHTGGISGLGVWLYGDDGNLYYYFHLDQYEGGATDACSRATSSDTPATRGTRAAAPPTPTSRSTPVAVPR